MNLDEKLEKIKKEEKNALIYGGIFICSQLLYKLITSNYIRWILILTICCGVYFILLLTTHGFLKILIKCSDSLSKIPHKKSKKISIPKETIVSAPYKTISKDEQREFQVAAIIGDKEKIEFFLNKGMNPDSEFSGKNPLKSAIFNDNSELVKLLLENGANPNFRFVDG